MAQLQFTVRNQHIARLDKFKVVADSENYLYAKFKFGTPEWDGLLKTAIFKKDGGDPYEMLIGTDGECEVPHEVLAGAGTVYVSVFGGSLVTVDVAEVKVYPSGYYPDLESSEDPTPSIYEQILSHVESLEDIAEQVGDAFEAAERAEHSADGAAISETNAAASAESAQASATAAGASATAAEASAVSAAASATSAANSAQDAYMDAERAEQAAHEAGYMEVEIDEHGHLIYTRTDAVDVDFSFDEHGHLIMEAI